MHDVKPPRAAWNEFPDVLIHASESAVKQHPRYQAAKSGDAEAAEALVRDTLNDAQVEALGRLAGGLRPTIVSVHAYEDLGVNAIPEAFADELAQRLGWPADDAIVQTNLVAHTGADGYGRLARQPAFDGAVRPGADYVLVDDFVGHGRDAREPTRLYRIQRGPRPRRGRFDRKAVLGETDARREDA